MRTRSTIVRALGFVLTVGLLTSLPLNASAQNIVANPGFENGNLTGWVSQAKEKDFITAARGARNPPSSPYEGEYYALFTSAPHGPPANFVGDGTLSQLLATTPGQAYTFGFWLNYVPPDARLVTHFVTYWNTHAIYQVGLIEPTGYQYYSFSVTATAATTEIKFMVDQINGGKDAFFMQVSLDDVSVAASSNPGALSAPEPGTFALMIGGGLGLALMRRRYSAR